MKRIKSPGQSISRVLILRCILVFAIIVVAFTGYYFYGKLHTLVPGDVVLNFRPTVQWENFWGEEIIKESDQEATNGMYIHQDHGYRYTVPYPEPTIYMFGNSTLWGAYVPDEDTIPSLLQQLVGSHYHVLNRAQNGYLIVSEVMELQKISLTPQDIVIFYDGRQDALPCADTDNISSPIQVVARFQKYSDIARAYTLKAGAKWYHFLQPTMYSLPPQNSTEQHIMDVLKQYPCFLPTEWYQAVYPQLEVLPLIDLTHVLDDYRRTGHSAYYDSVHTTAGSNAIIAEAIYAQLDFDF